MSIDTTMPASKTERRRYSLTTNSLVNRFFIASLIILPLFIILSGTLLLNTFKHSQINAEEEKLQTQIYSLLSLTELEDGSPILPEALAEPRLNQQNSGLYGFIYNASAQELWRSPSALLIKSYFSDDNNALLVNQRHFIQTYLDTEAFTANVLSYDVEWLDDNDQAQLLRFVVVSDASPLMAELYSYQSRLWQWLGTMGVFLILAQWLIMRWGLKPLTHLSQQLKDLQQHHIQTLDDNYPIEVQPVVDNFNQILIQEKQQRERYRNTMADLAHSLKTPLAVIQSQIDEKDQQSTTIHDQVNRINQIISHQLQRAVIRVNQNTNNQNTNKIPVKKVVDRLIKILTKVYQEKNITFYNLASAESYFYGDEADLLEVLGNLLDNACKYGKDKVVITTLQTDQRLTLCISDNGTGIKEGLNHIILRRGERADTVQPGQGIGLSVAVDIVSSYGGEISVNNNVEQPHLSGACFCLAFSF